jgi:hypothetical protein
VGSPERLSGRHALPVRGWGVRLFRRALAAVLLGAVWVSWPSVHGAFHDTTANPGNAWSGALTFPTYPQWVVGDGAELYHRADDAASPDATPAAADASGGSHPGVYGAPTDGPSTRYAFDEVSGVTAADSSGAANAGTRVNGPVWSTGLRDGGLTLDGNDQYLRGFAPGVDTSTSFSVSAWVKLSSMPIWNAAVVSQDGAQISAFFLQYRADTGTWSFNVSEADTVAVPNPPALSASPAVANRWTHLAGVYDDDADALRLYVDGVLSGAVAKTADWVSAGPLIVGAGWFGAARVDHLPGTVDEVHTFRRALTTTEVLADYSSPASLWEFGEGSGGTVADASGSANPGTLGGGTGWAGGAAVFDGVDDRVVADRPSVHTDHSFTVTARVLLDDDTGTRTVASQAGITSSAYTLGIAGGRYAFTMTGSDTMAPVTATAVSTTATGTGTWVELTGVYSDPDDQLRLYVDGHLEGTATLTADFDASGPLTAGRAHAGGVDTAYLAGRIDELRTTDRALSSEDVRQIADSPLLRYDFEQLTGSAVPDGSGEQQGGTRSPGGTTVLADGHRGSALTFDGSTGYVEAPRDVIDTTGSYAVAAWVRLSGVTPNADLAVVAQDGIDASAFVLGVHNLFGTQQWMFQHRDTDSSGGGSSRALAPMASAQPGVWTHLAGVYDTGADEIRLFVNGSLAATTPEFVDFPATGSLTVGAALFNGVRDLFWPGDVDEVRVYDRALSGVEIHARYDETPSVHFDADENAGVTLADRTGNGFTGTLAGGATWDPVGVHGSAVAFDGVDDHVTTAGRTVDTGADLSVSAWVKLTATGANRTAVSQDATTVAGYTLGYDSTADRWAFTMKDADDDANAGTDHALSQTPPTLGTWTHLVGTHDHGAEELRLYVDGVLAGTGVHGQDFSATGPLTLGRARLGAGYIDPWIGSIDEVRTYRRLLLADEVAALVTFTDRSPAPATLHVAGMSAGQPGALQGLQQGQGASTAVAFSGRAHLYNAQVYADPTAFSIELLFRSRAAGALAGFSDDPTAMGGDHADRVLYLDDGGRLSFAVDPGGVPATIRSAAAYDDGAWHHVVASLGAAGLRLYVDGRQVAADPATVSARATTGYWRFGGIDLTGRPHRPLTDHLVGTVDEIAVYPTQLTATQIGRHVHADH